MPRYVLTWLALVALATLSLVVSPGSLPLALAIAAVKATLVAAVFMHLADGPAAVHRIAFVTAIAFVAILVLGLTADVATRAIILDR